jgi:hypothetical protein
MSDPTPPPNSQLQIQLPDEVAQGVYSNLALIGFSDSDFTLDFTYVQPQQPRATVRARVIVSPIHAKRLALVLQENVARYEAQFGPITLPMPPGGAGSTGPRH